MYVGYLNTPVGKLQIFANKEGITSVGFVKTEVFTETENVEIQKCKLQLNEYFEGVRREFSLLFDVQGTEFYHKVLNEVTNVSYGTTVSYKEIAERAGYPGAYRAVGTVMRKNVLLIIIPCHRVIGSGGKPGAYSSGTEIKKWLLKHEAQSNQ